MMHDMWGRRKLKQTGILDSGATHIYIAPNSPYEKMDATRKISE